MGASGWGGSGAWGSGISLPAVTSPWGSASFTAPTVVDRQRYIRGWLQATPLEEKRVPTNNIAYIIDAIDASDYDIGGPTR